MTASNPDYLAQLNLLKVEFLNNCSQRGQRIKSAFAAALAANDPNMRVEALQQLHAEAHKLSGAAGTYGFLALSDAAHQIEQSCSSLLASGALPAVGDTERINRLLLSIADALQTPLD